ncbi:MAG: histidine phosphatase family protein [Rhodoferax sp.]|nr:histidine phosphatase family protein [Rhodoferax sp.]
MTAPGATSLPRSELWLVRHARPLVDDGVCYGATDLAADAHATAACAQQLARVLPSATPVWTSPMRRCTALADALRLLRPELGYRCDQRLTEMDFGCWEGVRWQDIPKAAIDEWTARFDRWRFGGRESVQELMDRVGAAWRESCGIPGPQLWITHAGVARAALLYSKGTQAITRSEDWPLAGPAFGECWRLSQGQSSLAPLYVMASPHLRDSAIS